MLNNCQQKFFLITNLSFPCFKSRLVLLVPFPEVSILFITTLCIFEDCYQNLPQSYTDDIFIVWMDGKESLGKFHQDFNNFCLSVKLTLEYSNCIGVAPVRIQHRSNGVCLAICLECCATPHRHCTSFWDF